MDGFTASPASDYLREAAPSMSARDLNSYLL
jgi:hypothetical protein